MRHGNWLARFLTPSPSFLWSNERSSHKISTSNSFAKIASVEMIRLLEKNRPGQMIGPPMA